MASRLEYLLTVNSCQGYFHSGGKGLGNWGFVSRVKEGPLQLNLGYTNTRATKPKVRTHSQSTLPSSIIISTPARCPPPLAGNSSCYYSTACPLPAAQGFAFVFPAAAAVARQARLASPRRRLCLSNARKCCSIPFPRALWIVRISTPGTDRCILQGILCVGSVDSLDLVACGPSLGSPKHKRFVLDVVCGWTLRVWFRLAVTVDLSGA